MVEDTKTSSGAFSADDALGALKPRAVPIKTARVLLGNKARSEIYEAAKRGELDLVKDGFRTLVTLQSIESYQAKWPRAVLGEPKHLEEGRREHQSRKRARKNRAGKAA